MSFCNTDDIPPFTFGSIHQQAKFCCKTIDIYMYNSKNGGGGETGFVGDGIVRMNVY